MVAAPLNWRGERHCKHEWLRMQCKAEEGREVDRSACWGLLATTHICATRISDRARTTRCQDRILI